MSMATMETAGRNGVFKKSVVNGNVTVVDQMKNGLVSQVTRSRVKFAEQTMKLKDRSARISNGRLKPKQMSVKSTQTASGGFHVHEPEHNGYGSDMPDRDNIPQSQLVYAPPSRLKKYLVALRPWSLSASFTPVSLGFVLAHKTVGEFSICLYVITCLTALSVHAAGNLVNTYFDFCKGVDSKKSDDRTLVDRILHPNDVAKFGAFFYVMGCVGFLLLTWMSPSKLEHGALLYFGGLSSSFLYTGGLGLKYIALGDIAIFLTFGPLTVMFSYLAQAGELSFVPLIYAIPLALNTEAVLHANNSRDMDTDREAGIITFAILIGPTLSYIVFVLLLFVPYICFVLMGVHCSAWMFLPVVSIPKAFEAERLFREHKMRHLPQHVAKLNLALGVLYTISCFAAKKGVLPHL
ncbi:ubiA prenyltransferase domain-containing protein 1-like [Liolophura sinensis]|uniref:ubiA prenyltransferase domain-containing protein 1-like n=1 Tax=Liolophura sinensis TaxID=3198878 RepID=UPI003158411B